MAARLVELCIEQRVQNSASELGFRTRVKLFLVSSQTKQDCFHSLVFGLCRLNLQLSARKLRRFDLSSVTVSQTSSQFFPAVQNLKTFWFNVTWNSYSLVDELIIDLPNCCFKLSNKTFYHLFNVMKYLWISLRWIDQCDPDDWWPTWTLLSPVK